VPEAPCALENRHSGEPNNSGLEEEPLEIVADGSPTWNDGTGAIDRRAPVEWPAACNDDGVVGFGQILVGELADANDDGERGSCESVPCLGDLSGNDSVNGGDLAALLDARVPAGEMRSIAISTAMASPKERISRCDATNGVPVLSELRDPPRSSERSASRRTS
jgi:hypothetical protein